MEMIEFSARPEQFPVGNFLFERNINITDFDEASLSIRLALYDFSFRDYKTTIISHNLLSVGLINYLTSPFTKESLILPAIETRSLDLSSAYDGDFLIEIQINGLKHQHSNSPNFKRVFRINVQT